MAFTISEELISKAEENVKRIINLYDRITYNEFLKELGISDRHFTKDGYFGGFTIREDKEEALNELLPWAIAAILKYGY